MKVYELRKNKRAQALRGKNAGAPGVSTANKITVVVKAKDSFFESVAIKKRDNLVQEILNRKQYAEMKPLNVVTGTFEVEKECLADFLELVSVHGLTARMLVSPGDGVVWPHGHYPDYATIFDDTEDCRIMAARDGERGVE